MSKEINIARNITNLRKRNKVTQEQLADALNVSPQAVSKWETASCQPDTLMLPLIADFFHVSIDYLFYGCEETNDEIYEIVTNRVAAKEAYTTEPHEEALKLSTAAQHGILKGLEESGKAKNDNSLKITEIPLHLLDLHGFSLSSPKGFSAIVTNEFLNSIDSKTMKRAGRIFDALADRDCLRITIEILNFQGISLYELKNKMAMEDKRLKNAIAKGKKAGFIQGKKSSHEILGSEFFIQRHHFNCLCLILSSIKMIEISLRGATRWMYHTKHSISFEESSKEISSTSTADTSFSELQ